MGFFFQNNFDNNAIDLGELENNSYNNNNTYAKTSAIFYPSSSKNKIYAYLAKSSLHKGFLSSLTKNSSPSNDFGHIEQMKLKFSKHFINFF